MTTTVVFQVYGMHKALVVDDCVLTKIIKQGVFLIVKFIPCRIAMEVEVEFNYNCNFLEKNVHMTLEPKQK